MKTKYFGDIAVDKNEIITFTTGLFGFEDKTEYVLLSFSDNNDTSDDLLLCLQSAEDPDLALMVMNPYYICADYDPYQLSDKLLTEIRLGEETKHTVCCVAVIRENFEQSTINLKCPIIINLEDKLAKQFILEDSDYSMRHPVVVKEV
ncbi:flagellar assembly protein FliW [Aminipila terrae]|uniref:Flagellar assembly factor FliW n=1 Tax=Aminipila terrae TaxID=2697030 RepID=A0A6P1MB77_9FIRM|nr:flagellar assembly protein FliW [Aminipila terrae]QHI71939.1 flagellar assembly protein FliW [Aminipila terrae]